MTEGAECRSASESASKTYQRLCVTRNSLSKSIILKAFCELTVATILYGNQTACPALDRKFCWTYLLSRW